MEGPRASIQPLATGGARPTPGKQAVARMNIARLQSNWDQVNDAIAAAATRAGRDPSGVRLVAVTKRNPAAFVRALAGIGATDLGENYPQELWGKAEALVDLAAVRWHLIGHLQRNKLKRTLPLVRMVHAVDSAPLLAAIDAWAGTVADPPAVCLQVNTSGEEAKHGWGPDAPGPLAEAVTAPRHVRVAGLMTIAGYGTTNDEARPCFEHLRSLRDDLETRTGRHLPELSMGMSGDFAAAIAAGSTLIRVGSALFEGVEAG